MSSFIEFRQRDNNTLDRARSYFAERQHYTRVEDGYSYENEDTGCHFFVDTETPQTDEDGEEASGPAVSFNLNYVRPKPFIREAVAEVAAFNTAFPGPFRNEETGNIEEFDSSRYIVAWTDTNDGSVRHFAKEHETSGVFAPATVVEQVWKWNSGRRVLQQSLGEDKFVAAAKWIVAAPNSAVPAIIWTEGVPTVFPAFAEQIIFVSKPTERPSLLRRLFGQAAEPDFVIRVLPAKTVLADFVPEPVLLEGTLTYSSDAVFPAAILKSLNAVKPVTAEELQLVSPHLVLEAETLTE